MSLPSEALARELAARLPPESVCTDRAERQRFALGGVPPQAVVYPSSEEEVATAVACCAELRAALVPWGGGARQRQVPPPWQYDVALVLSRLNRVLRYEPDDLTMTVQCGCRMDSLAAVLAARRQWLPFDVALPGESTVGGVVASATVGWERSGQLSTRDLLLGVTFVAGRGEVVRGGGAVVKNVAGYDMMRLVAGSWGTLGVVTQVTWKLLPEPPEKAVGWVGCRSLTHALEQALAGDRVRPQPSGLAVVGFASSAAVADPQRAGVVVAYTGSAGEVQEGKSAFEEEVENVHWFPHLTAATELLRRIRDFSLVGPTHPWAAGLRLALLPSDLAACVEEMTTFLDEDNTSVCIWPQRGTVYVRFTEQSERSLMRRAFLWAAEFAQEHRGWAWPDWWPEGWEFDAVSLPHLYLSRHIKDALDPMGIFSPGRYWRHW